MSDDVPLNPRHTKSLEVANKTQNREKRQKPPVIFASRRHDAIDAFRMQNAKKWYIIQIKQRCNNQSGLRLFSLMPPAIFFPSS
jgi:hypothetical protein